jgi:3D (Asp-Asp-Asp) domain-containing protein
MESDPIFANDQKVAIQGFPEDQTFRRGFIHGRGVLYQGTGIAEDGRYITIDWAWSTYDPDNVENNDWWFREGIGRDVEAWKTVATVDPRLPMGTRIAIEHYQDKGVFRVTDRGTELRHGQIDVFVGVKSFAETDALGLQISRVGIVR